MHFKKGSLYLTIAWAITLLSGYIYNIWLTHRFSQAMYGDYQVVMSVLLWLEIWLGLVIRRIRWLIYRWRLSRLARKERK